jgi:hypothetical protein
MSGAAAGGAAGAAPGGAPTPSRGAALTPVVRLLGGLSAAAASLVLGVLAAWPIYQTSWLWLVAAVALVLGGGIAWARARWRIRFPVLAAIVLGVFALTAVPVAVPESLTIGPLRGLLDGLAAVALGWKQLLTLALPVGTYRTVLVPAYVVLLATALLVTVIAQHPGRRSAFAAIPMLAPVAFGTVFGASQTSAPLHLGPLTIVAPREIGIWLVAALLAAVWVAWTSGADRRAALRLGRVAGDRRSGGIARAFTGAAILVVVLAAGAILAPVLDADARAVPRDRIDPEIVIRDRPSPLAAYRSAKRDDTIDRTMFTVQGDRGLPQRLRLSVLDSYDGVDFHVSQDAAGRFTRFPSGESLTSPSRIGVEIGEGYADIWAPTAKLGSPPRFSGPRAEALSDAFYVNRETGGAIAVPRDGAVTGLAEGDGYSADMETAPASGELGAPSGVPQVELDETPEMATWIDHQNVAADAEGLTEMIDRLRARGYLSHAMSESEGERVWLERLSEQYGTSFEPSAGGHSLARIEDLFAQLNAQQAAAGENPDEAQLVAGVGDDEQFAAAAALVARALGYDSRVVLGVRLGGEEIPGVPACANACTGEHLAAWIEVRGDRGDWVAFDVTPQLEQRPQRLEEGEQLPEFPTTPEERDVREVDPPIGLGEQGESDVDPTADRGDFWLWPVLRIVGLSAAALALLLIPLLFLPVAKRLRRRRRRAEPDPELRALGAWEEMVDRARDAGAEVPTAATRREVGAALATRPAVWAAQQVDRAVFSPVMIGDDEADLLWRAADEDRAERAASMKRAARLRAAYSLRSYGLRRDRRRAAPAESEIG